MPDAIHRIEVRPRPGELDPRGAAACRDAETLGLAQPPSRIDAAAIYLIQGELGDEQVRRLAEELLAEPVTESATIGARAPAADALIEVHPLPGVMDPDAEAVESAVRAMLGVSVRVRTARRYDMHGTDADTARRVAEGSLANPVIHAIYDAPHHPASFPSGSATRGGVGTIVIEDMDDRTLAGLSRDAHLFLSVAEMKAIQAEYRRLGRDPREIELETIAQTWSEHCVHKTFRSTIRYREDPGDRGHSMALAGRPGHEASPDGSVTIHNLFKSTIVAATNRLIAEGVVLCLSVFVVNAGVIAFDDEHAVCFKVETHNHPSALEPYGGAATGIGGCIRDVIGTGLSARPIASTDVFCVAFPDHWSPSSLPLKTQDSRLKTVPSGILHPARILRQVVAGVRDYGNRMGIPTLNGAVWFDDDYVGNPLVFCGCVGVLNRDGIKGAPRAGDHIVVLGGRTGRDGIHGATFSSAQLTDSHADEFGHAVQIGNAVTEKKLLEAILEARDRRLFTAITDCGAGGFSSAVGEMGSRLGAEVHLDRAPLKYTGLSPTEIWISEAQERMVLAVPEASIEALRDICTAHDVEMCELGVFGTADRELILHYRHTEVGRLSMHFLHDGLPRSTRDAVWCGTGGTDSESEGKESVRSALLRLLAHPNIASKRWIIRQYDHEVQGGSVVKPLVGVGGEGPSDAAVIVPVLGSKRGLAIANGLATGLRDDPYLMAMAAVDEAVRNLVCVGADPDRIALLDNFCWPSCREPRQLAELVRAAEGCHDAAIAYRTPYISGKDSFNNQFTTETGDTIAIPPTLLISGLGIVADIADCVTMDAKQPGNQLVVVGRTEGRLGGSHFERLTGPGKGTLAVTDLKRGPAIARTVHRAITARLVRSAHDCSDGGLLVAAAEMAMAGNLGLDLDCDGTPDFCFCEEPSRYLLEVAPENLAQLTELFGDLPCARIGTFNDSGRLTLPDANLDVTVQELLSTWLAPLDW